MSKWIAFGVGARLRSSTIDLPFGTMSRFQTSKARDWPNASERVKVEVDGPVTLGSQELMVGAALQGCGLACVWDSRVTQLLASGAIDPLPWTVGARPTTACFSYYPSRRYLSAGLRAVIDMLKSTQSQSYSLFRP
jgi:DNA-binding transcriptional LysR family regulator